MIIEFRGLNPGLGCCNSHSPFSQFTFFPLASRQALTWRLNTPLNSGREKNMDTAHTSQCSGLVIALRPSSSVEHVRHVIGSGPAPVHVTEPSTRTQGAAGKRQRATAARKEQWEYRLRPSPPETVRIIWFQLIDSVILYFVLQIQRFKPTFSHFRKDFSEERTDRVCALRW